MKNAEQLREEMCEVYDKLKSGDLAPTTAREMVKTTTAQIGLAKVQLEYCAMRNVKPEIKFLDCK